MELWDVLDEHGNKTGRLHERGKPLQAGEGHLVVQIWIMNSAGEFLITRRVETGGFWDGLWHTTGGCATAGDDSLTAVLREAKEELDIELIPENGQLFMQSSEKHFHDDGTCFFDVWLFRQEIVPCGPAATSYAR